MNYSYLRLSTNEDNQSNSFDVQSKHIELKYSIDKTFTDTLSGSTPFDKRTGWIELMSHISSGDNILIHRLDRLTRSTLNFLVCEQQLKKIGVSLIFVEGVSNEDTAEAKLMRVMLSAMAEFERSMIRTRIIQTKQLQKQQGKFLGGKIPYGSIVVDGALIDDDEEQTIIKQMIRLRDKGLSYSKVSAKLTDLGYSTRNGTTFANVQIQRVINAQQGLK